MQVMNEYYQHEVIWDGVLVHRCNIVLCPLVRYGRWLCLNVLPKCYLCCVEQRGR